MPPDYGNIPSDIRPLKEREQARGLHCMAQHSGQPPDALYELRIAGDKPIYLCQFHVDDFIEQTVTGIEPENDPKGLQ